MSHSEVLPKQTLLLQSPFAYLAKDNPAVLERLMKAFVTVRFGRGDLLPPSPFYFVARGHVTSRVVADGRHVATKRQGGFINWSAEFTEFSNAFGRVLLSCLPNAATEAMRSRKSKDPHAMQLVGASDGHVCILTANSLQTFLESSPAAVDLIRQASDIAASEIPMVVKARVTEPHDRLLTALCTFRYVRPGKPVFLKGEIGNAFAIVLRGVLQPTCHGAVAVALDFSSAEKHWKSLKPVRNIKDALSKASGTASTSSADVPAGAGTGTGTGGEGGSTTGAPAEMMAHSRNGEAQDKDVGYVGSDDKDVVNSTTKTNQLGPGSTIGVAAMLVGDDGAAVPWLDHDDAVTAEGAVVAIVNKGHELTQFLALLPPSSEIALQRVARARILRTFAAGMLGQAAQSAQAQRRLMSIADRCRLVFAAPGEVIVYQGAEVGALHIVVNGAVRATTRRQMTRNGHSGAVAPNPASARPNSSLFAPAPAKRAVQIGTAKVMHSPAAAPAKPEVLRSITAGQAFGEAALLLRGALSDATYRAETEGSGCAILEVPRHLFFQMLAKDRTLLAALHVKLLRNEASLAALLAHPIAKSAFYSFVSRMCGDSYSLIAYEAMQSYAKLGPKGFHAAAKSVGEGIVVEFLGDGARTLPLSNAIKEKVLSNVPKHSDVSWPPTLFDPACVQLNAVISNDYMPRFKAHSVFHTVLEMLGSYEADALFPTPESLEAGKAELRAALIGDAGFEPSGSLGPGLSAPVGGRLDA